MNLGSPIVHRVGVVVVSIVAFAGGALLAKGIFADDDPVDAATADGDGTAEGAASEAEAEADSASDSDPGAGASGDGDVDPAIDTPDTTTSAAPVEHEPLVQVVSVDPPTGDDALAMADTLGLVMTLPSDCGLPLDVPESLPNSPREYRNGTHQGIDFICLERGRIATAAMAGQIVVAVGDYQDPTPAERGAILDIAGAAGTTPPFTLAMMYGNYVVIDHGVLDGVGHVVSVYAHFDSLAEDVRPGLVVEAGHVLGEIGNKGTNSGATGSERPQSIHLHWEVHIDGLHLGIGLGTSDTREVYRRLFAASL